MFSYFFYFLASIFVLYYEKTVKLTIYRFLNFSNIVYEFEIKFQAKITKLQAEVAKLEKALQQEQVNKKKKEQEGTRYVKEAREDLQKLTKLWLEKKLENEDMEAKVSCIFVRFQSCRERLGRENTH